MLSSDIYSTVNIVWIIWCLVQIEQKNNFLKIYLGIIHATHLMTMNEIAHDYKQIWLKLNISILNKCTKIKKKKSS